MKNENVFKIGVDIGGTNIAFGLLDPDLKIIAKKSVPFPRYDDGTPEKDEKTVEIIAEQSKDLCMKAKINYDAIALIGICVPGSVDISSGTVIDAYNLGFHNVPLKQMIEKSAGRPVLLQNDADAAVKAEHRIGALKNHKNGILVTIGTGFGGGIIINDSLYRGGLGNGIELGHIQMDVHGEKCTCGRNGCIETLCSASWLKNQAERLLEKKNAVLENYRENQSPVIDARALIECVKTGDKACKKIWETYLSNLADALTSLINVLDPEIIAIGGGVSAAGDMLIKPVEKLVMQRCFFKKHAEIVKAELGNDAGMIGSVIGF